jgi:hypothetical protein
MVAVPDRHFNIVVERPAKTKSLCHRVHCVACLPDLWQIAGPSGLKIQINYDTLSASFV